MLAPLEALPPELYSAILSHVAVNDLQQTVLSLTRAIPRSPVPIHHLFEHVRLRHSDQAFQLYRRLRKCPEDAASVYDFALECWAVDADIVVNLVALLPRVTDLTLWVGPNFSPEHLEEMFQHPMEGLKFISLRFRPYVQRATYYQFLKGAYFDSTLLALSRWPAANLSTLSIVQDPLDPTIAPTQFAQPLVFFRLDPLSTLAQSPLVEQLFHFRMRIPARQAARYLYALPRTLPSIELLDLSTCNVHDADIEGILGRFGRLRSLVLDGCSVVSQRVDAQAQGADALGQWAALGKMMALAGAKYAREREKQLKAWQEAASARAAALANDQLVVQEERAPRRSRRGRRGLATATISLRQSPPRDSKPLPGRPPTRGPPSSVQKIRVLARVPSLRSVATTAPPSVGSDKHEAIRADFERGWAEGIAQLSAIRARLKTSWGNGVRVVMFDEQYVPDEDDDDGDNGLAGLKDVDNERAFLIQVADRDEGEGSKDGVDDGKCPLLCLAGPGPKDGHMAGCGHQLGWQVWRDEL
ncbi:hypothetical protein AcW1_001275 [Taiwanofungus camphoratus]|nr:hypothetical protein AcW2_000200 [Antrodia cinnamomea]KAI0962457.1 hypothetical protein AcV7_001297 [Antrodia cinnamomea]KAI0964460.1 hypothetical protein AcW1_001275 [Antrodia cinnamomea]